jgi:NADPH:quinone reductase-like Zn-dependent oxidoreductase
MDFAGLIVSAPKDSGFVKGDKVYGATFGAYAEYVVIDLKKGSGAVRKVPKGWTLAEACSVGASGATTLGCFLRAGPVREGSWVLVTGATGGLGTMACQIAKRLGARVVALVGKDKSKERVLKDLGVDQCVHYDVQNWEQKIKDVTGGGVDLVYDAVGMVESSLKCCAYGGRVVIVGFAGRGGDIEKVRMNRILLKSASVMGYRFGEHGRRHPEQVKEIWRDFDAMVEEGGIRAVVYDQKYLGLDSVPRAMNDLAEHKVWGRAAVQIADENGVVGEKSLL